MTKPWAHQLKAIEENKDRDFYGLFFEQGTGKTFTTIKILCDKFRKEKHVFRTLILCPKIVVPNWKEEFLKFSDYADLKDYRITTLEGSGAKRLKELSKQKEIVITNIEVITIEKVWTALKEYGFRALVIDESHKFKDYKSKRTKAIKFLADQAFLKYKYILTGTPIANDAGDIWGQFRILNKDIFGDSSYKFRLNWFYDANQYIPGFSHKNWQLKPEAEEEFNRLIYAHGMRVLKKDVLDLPPFVRQIVNVEMTPKQAKIYKDLKTQFIAYLDDKACVAQLAVTKALRLQQVLSGIFKDDEGKVTMLDHNRVKVLKEVIEGLPSDSQFIIWATFRDSYKEISDLLASMKIAFGEIVGGQTEKNRNFFLENFRNGNCRALICNQNSAGTGVNLTQASYSIYYARSYSVIDDQQSEARNYRGGSDMHESVTRIDLVTPGTIDDIILKALRDKKDLAKSILELRNLL